MEEFLISVIIALFLLLVPLHHPNPLFSIAANNNNTTDYEALVYFKNELLKQQSSSAASALIMSSWGNDTNKHFCSWEGVTCGGRKHPDRVTALNLSSSGLRGPLPPSISNLTFLRRLYLNNNSLYGEITPSLSRLHRLQYLTLASNSLQGALPTNLSSELIKLDLSNNHFFGKIPSAFFFFLPKLIYLNIESNNMSGNIPTSLGNLSSIKSIHMNDNNLEGSIPAQIGSLKNFIYLSLTGNNLSGIIPSSIYNLSYLSVIILTDNRFSGGLSTNIASTLPRLETLYLGGNMLSGSLIQALSNCTSLVKLDASDNNFTGRIPTDFGNMQNLNHLNLEQNELESNDAESWKFLDSLTNCTGLQVLSLAMNELGGVLPKSIANLSVQLQFLSITMNYISGNIPSEIGNLVNLTLLAMNFNNLSGVIPNSIGKLEMLQELSFGINGLTGAIPWSLANLTGLSRLELNDNQLIGTIPSNFGNLLGLNALNLEYNNLVGTIPKELFDIPSLSTSLSLAGNYFDGTLPPEVGKLVTLTSLDLSNNKFTGKIPPSLGSCQMLTNLYMDNNLFYGPIPTSVGNLKSLEILDLSHNNLSGVIPNSLQNLNFLRLLNLSYNKFEGEVPNVGVFRNATAIYLVGNNQLCGGIPELHFPACVQEDFENNSKKKRRLYHVLRILIPIISALIIFLSFTAILYYYKYKKQHQRSKNASHQVAIEESFLMISYAELVKATDEFSSANLIGRGRYGSVYKGALHQGQTTVAIKVFNLDIQGGFRSFTAECDALRNIRHRNLVRVLTCCSTIDFKGKDFKALVFEFMPKGNLDMWLHQEDASDGEVFLNLEQRLNIIIDVADALEYLHHSCQPPIIHCDMKPSNILLDDDMIAHVGDFGLARILSESMGMPLQNSDSRSWIKGTIGYVAPEYGRGANPSSSGDVYSFGILLLEMLTGRRPIDDIFKDNLNLHNLVAVAYPHRLTDILDLKILVEEQEEADMSSVEEARRDDSQSITDCLLSIAEVGLSCSATSPRRIDVIGQSACCRSPPPPLDAFFSVIFSDIVTVVIPVIILTREIARASKPPDLAGLHRLPFIIFTSVAGAPTASYAAAAAGRGKRRQGRRNDQKNQLPCDFSDLMLLANGLPCDCDESLLANGMSLACPMTLAVRRASDELLT